MDDILSFPQGVRIAPTKLASCARDENDEFSKKTNTDLAAGYYVSETGEVIFATGANENTLIHHKNYTEFPKPIILNDFTLSNIDLQNRGLLFKKENDPNLWWRTENTEYNITAGIQYDRIVDPEISNIEEPEILTSKLSHNGVIKLEVTDKEIITTNPLFIPHGNFSHPNIKLSESNGIYSTDNSVIIKSGNMPVFNINNSKIKSEVIIDCPSINIGNYAIYCDKNTRTYSSNNTHLMQDAHLMQDTMYISLDGNPKIKISDKETKISTDLSIEGNLSLRNSKIIDADHALQLEHNGINIATFDTTGLKTDGIKTNIINVNKILFSNSDINMRVDSSDLHINAKNTQFTGSINTSTIKMSDGVLFSKSDGCLYWQNAFGETNIIQDLIEKSNVYTYTKDSYTFKDAPDTGMFLEESKKLTLSIDQNPAVIIDANECLIKTSKFSLASTKSNGKLSLYEKNKDLVCILEDGNEYNLTNPLQRYPILIPDKKSIDFAGLQITSLNKSIDIAQTLKIIPNQVSINGVINLYNESGKSKLFMKNNQLLCEINDTSYILNNTNYYAVPSNNLQKPEYSFRNDEDTGMSKIEDNTIGFITGGHLSAIMSPDQIITLKPLVFKDINVNIIPAESDGYLYKKEGKLIWQTQSDELNLTEPRYPFKAPNGNIQDPSYGFQSEGGLYKSFNGIGISDGTNLIANFNQRELTISGGIKMSNSILSAKDDTLLWNSIPISNPYRETIQYPYTGIIKPGDIVSFDLNEQGSVQKCVGGKISKLSDGYMQRDTYYIFDYSNDKYIAVSTSIPAPVPISVSESIQTSIPNNLINVNINLTSKQNNYAEKSYSFNEECKTINYHNLLRIGNNIYALVYGETNTINVALGNNTGTNTSTGTDIRINNYYICKLINIFDKNPIVEKISFSTSELCDKVVMHYDTLSKFIVFIGHNSTNQKFIIRTIDMQTNSVSDENILPSDIIISDITKQMNIVSVPGGTYIVSYGHIKFLFIISANTVIFGESFVDYESFDCVDMIYDFNKGVVLSLEKMISGTSYVQSLEILGTKIQKITSRGFNNDDIQPYSISYNNITATYSILYATGITKDIKDIYVQMFEFDGDCINYKLRYRDYDSTFDRLIKNVKIYEIPGTKFLTYKYGIKSLLFEIDYKGSPDSHLGIVNKVYNDENIDICQITIRGHIYYNLRPLPTQWLGKKIYITNPDLSYPENLSINKSYGIFFGTCLDMNRILVGL